MEDHKARLRYFRGALSWDILPYVNPTLETKHLMLQLYTQVRVKNLLNCQGDIDQTNYILQNIEHIVYECRQYGVKQIFLSCLTITNRLPEQLIKDFNISICNICSRKSNCHFIDNANIKLNEV